MKAAPDKWGTPIKRDLSGVDHLRQLRGVKTFADFPRSTQDIYLQVARCFPGWQVWAVGSRVRGDYVTAICGSDVHLVRRHLSVAWSAQL